MTEVVKDQVQDEQVAADEKEVVETPVEDGEVSEPVEGDDAKEADAE